MIAGASSITTPVLTNALQGVSWSVLLPYTILIVWLTCFVIALLHPVSRVFLHCNWVLLTKHPLHRMYMESDKKAGRWFAHVTCIAILNDEGCVTRLFYGKPELTALMQAHKEKQNG